MAEETETIQGVPVTGAMIQAWANEAEAGYSPDRLHPVKRDLPPKES